MKDLIDAGIHFGHRVSRWNPKMQPYIFGKRNLIHIIDVKESLRGILLAKKFITKVVSQGKDIVLVGTKRQARKAVQEMASTVNMHWVTERWLGGTLTNFREIRKRVGRLDELEQLETDGLLDAYSKKQGASLRREMRKIRRNLGGIRNMEQAPGAVVVIDQRREIIAVREARKLSIPVICLLDTDSNPDLVDIAIPGNDDSMRAITIIVKQICDAVSEGIAMRAKLDEKDKEEEPTPRRRSTRPTTARAEETPAADAPVAAEAEAPSADAAPVAAKAPAPAAAPAPAKAPAPAAPAAPAPAADVAPPAHKGAKAVVAPAPAPAPAPAADAAPPAAKAPKPAAATKPDPAPAATPAPAKTPAPDGAPPDPPTK